MSKEKLHEKILYVKGLHCPSCEILIEKRIIKEDAVDEVNVSTLKGTAQIICYEGEDISVDKLNKIFKKDGYVFSEKKFDLNSKESINCPTKVEKNNNIFTSIIIAFGVIGAYLLLTKSEISTLVSVDENSSLFLFLMFGVLAGFSSCAALVGGIILSLSKQWLEMYGDKADSIKKSEPHILFNMGRVFGYSLFGGILGIVGGTINISPLFTASLVIVVSIFMIIMGMQMTGFKFAEKLQIKLPKFITREIANEENFKGKMAPIIMGALTFFLPCGFTVTAQALSLTSGSFIKGALIMGLFALGTVPSLLMIGLGSASLHSNPKLSKNFSLVAGILVMFFALFNINSQMTVLGFKNFDDVVNKEKVSDKSLARMENGVQIIEIEARASSYSPTLIKIRANTKTRIEVKSINVSGCTNAIISRGLFEGQIDLVNGKTSTKEFVSPKPGVYKYSCWMGMVAGTIEVVDDKGEIPEGSVVEEVKSTGSCGGSGTCGCGGGGTGKVGGCGGNGGSCGGIKQ